MLFFPALDVYHSFRISSDSHDQKPSLIIMAKSIYNIFERVTQ